MTDYTLKRSSRSRSIRIQVQPSGKVILTAPRLTPVFMINRFVTKSLPWIAKQKRRLELRKQQHKILDWNTNSLMYKGKQYSLVFNTAAELSPVNTAAAPQSLFRVSVEKTNIMVNPVTSDPKHSKKTLLFWLKQQAEQHIVERTRYWAPQMDASYKNIRFKQQKSRWGSCSSKGTLSFNWRLIHFSPEVIDYVIIHELAHTKQMNHSPHFWAIVKRYCPDYKKHVAFLKQQVIEIEKLT